MFELIRANQRRAAFLVVVMAGLLIATGYALGEIVQEGAGPAGLLGGFALWAVLSLVAYSSGDSIFLALAGARRIEKKDHPILWNVVEEMCVASGLATPPAVHVIDQDAPNAFATGRSETGASIAVTAGLLERLDRDELQGVIGHELAHIKNRDVLYLMMLGALAGAVVILADAGRRFLWYGRGRRRTSDKGGGGAIILLAALVLMIVAPIVAQLLYLAVSRRREYLADACGARFTRYPEGLACALEKIAAAPASLPGVSRAMAPMYINDPLARPGVPAASSWGGTHPPIEERVRILRSMAGEASLARYDETFRKVTRRPVGVFPAAALAEERAGAERAGAAGARPGGPGDATRPPVSDPRTRVERVRETTDMFWRLKGFAFLPCACGTTLKAPPAYAGQTLNCPHCGAPHQVP
jgi:heat shock protein HtpX